MDTMVMTFKSGVSGNPKGKPKGTKTKRTLITEALDAISKERSVDVRKQIVEATLNASLAGDMTATSILLNRLEPAYKPVSAPVELGQMPVDAAKKTEQIVQLITDGQLSPDVGKDIINSIVLSLKVSELTDIEKRLADLEISNTTLIAEDKSNDLKE